MKESDSQESGERRSIVLIVLDGWCIARAGKFNAISLARKPNFDWLKQTFGSIEICASGECVGLSRSQMGNSEVGHLTLGAGRVIFQDLLRVSDEIKSGRLAKNKVLVSAFKKIKNSSNSSLHFIGLVSDGGVHSNIDHLFALLRIAKKAGAKRVKVHSILDGRDSPPRSGIDFSASLQSFLETLGIG